MITLNSFVLIGLLTRIVIVIFGTLKSLKAIGFEDIKFLMQYVRKRAFESHKIIIWIVAIGTLIYFDSMISNSEEVGLLDSFRQHWLLTLLVVFLLVGVNIYAILDAKNSITIAKETKQAIKNAKNAKGALGVLHFASWFVPGGLFVKAGLFGLSIFAHSRVDKHIENTVKNKITETMTIIIIIAIVNLSMVLASVYLITGKVIFW